MCVASRLKSRFPVSQFVADRQDLLHELMKNESIHSYSGFRDESPVQILLYD